MPLRSWIALFCLLGATAACSRGRTDETPADESSRETVEAEAPESEEGTPAPDAGEFDDFIFRQRMDEAVRLRNAGQLEAALAAADDAIALRPDSAAAGRLRAQIGRQLGRRGDSTATVLDDALAAARANLEEQRVSARRWLLKGSNALQVEDWSGARRAYERVDFIANSARLSPLGEDARLLELAEQARTGLAEVERAEASAARDQARSDAEAALDAIASQEERELLEARDRRERLLESAVDRFNIEDFDAAQTYAQQILDEEPDNTVARELVDAARQARHGTVQKALLRDLKDSFRRWTVDIDRSKIPQSRILAWPSQSYWDRITRLRKAQTAGYGGRTFTEEERAVQAQLGERKVDLLFEKATPFPKVVDYLVASSGLNIIVDARARDDLDAVEVTLEANDLTLKDALDLLLAQASPEGEIVHEVVGNVVRFVKKENQRRSLELRVHPVADLTLGLTDFIPPAITLVGVDEESETPLFGGQAEEAPQAYGTIEELMELVRSAVAPGQWEDPATIAPQGKALIVRNTPAVQAQVSAFLDDLRTYAGVVITIESRFLTISDNFLRDVGVDMRGLGGANGGPLAVLDDVTSGLDDSASAGIDNGGPGVNSGAAALAPASGFFFNDGSDGDFRGRTENIFGSALGQALSALGGGTFQLTYLDDSSVSALIRATEKTSRTRELNAPTLTVYNTQRAHLTSIRQIGYIQDFDVEVAQTAFIADPVVGVLQEGVVLDVRPVVSNDRKYITLEIRPTSVDLALPITTFSTLLGAAARIQPLLFGRSLIFNPGVNPVVIQLPEITIRSVESTIRIPDGGSILLGGLKQIRTEDLESTTPILGRIPVLRFLFGRTGKSEEVQHDMMVVTATVNDLPGQGEPPTNPLPAGY